MLGKFMLPLLAIVGFRLKIVRRSVAAMLKSFGKGKRLRNFALPVAGLEEPKAQLIIFTLRRTASTRAERHMARDWLAAWQLTQVACNRLLHELDEVQENLKFWKQRSNVDDHFWFLLLQQGPEAFYKQIRQMFVHKREDVEAMELSEADMIEKRVLLLQLLSTMLCEALARVQRAGEILYMQEQESSPTPSGDNYSPLADSVSSFGGGGGDKDEEEDIFDRVELAVDHAMREVEEAFTNLRSKARSVLEVPASKPMAISKEKSLLMHATTKVLRMKTRKPEASAGRQRVSRQPTLVKVEEVVEEDVDEQEEAATAAVMHVEEEEEEELYRVTDVSGPVLYVSTLDSVRRGRRAIGVRPSILPPLPTNAPAHLAWERACSASRRLRTMRIFTLPSWLRMPSEAQRNWIKNTLVGLAAAYATIFLYRHSRLSGSRDLEMWICDMGESLESAVKDNMVKPLSKVTGGLFKTYKRRSDEREYNADRDSLKRMIADFKADMERRGDEGSSGASEFPFGLPFALPWTGASGSSQGLQGNPGSAAPAASPAAASTASVEPQLVAGEGAEQGNELAAGGSGAGASTSADEEIEEVEPSKASRRPRVSELDGMELVMRAYEEAIKNPIKGLVTGQLPRTLLIQLQKMKTDGANTMVEMDQIIKSNELTVSLIAAVPAFLIAGSAAYTTVKWLTPRPPDSRWEAVPCRLAVLQLAQALERICRREEENALDEMDEDRGWFYYCLAMSHEEASSLFRRKRGLLLGRNAWREWPALRGDLIDLASPAPINARLRTTKRMMRAYSVFRY